MKNLFKKLSILLLFTLILTACGKKDEGNQDTLMIRIV